MAKGAELAVLASASASRGGTSTSVEGASVGGKSTASISNLATIGRSHLDSGSRFSLLGLEGHGRLLMTTSRSRARLASRLSVDEGAGGGLQMPPAMPRPDDEQRKRGIVVSLALVRRFR